MEYGPQTDRIALVIAAPGIWRDALVSLLRAQPNLAVCHVVSDPDTARVLIERGAVAIVFTECSADERPLLDFLTWLQDAHPAVRCVVAVDTRAQKAHCIAAGAYMTLLKGWLDERVLQQAVAG